MVHGLSCPAACGILAPQPGIQSASPALEDGFLTTGPPGKSPRILDKLDDTSVLASIGEGANICVNQWQSQDAQREVRHKRHLQSCLILNLETEFGKGKIMMVAGEKI